MRLNPNFSLAQAFYGVTLCYCGRWEEGDLAARRALRLSPRDPFSAIYLGIAAYAQFIGRNYDEAIRLAHEALRQRGDFVGGHRVLTRRRRQWPDRSTPPRFRCRNFVACNPTSRSPGSPTNCRCSKLPIANTIWKASAVRAWNECGLFFVVPKVMAVLAVAAPAMAGAGMLARVEAKPGVTASSAAKLERLSEFFASEVATGKLAGAMVLIQQHGVPVYLKGFGVRSIATGQPMTPDTLFALHSMTKPITDLAAMMLIDEGKLALADPVSKYIPAFASAKVGVQSETRNGQPVLKLVPPNRPVNVEDLMRHTSGLSYDYIGGDLIRAAYAQADVLHGKFDNKVLAERIAGLPLVAQPGTLWRYGYSTDVLGRIIEIVSGKSLFQFLKLRIFDPLGMTSTEFVLGSPAEQARMAKPLPSDAVLLLSEKQRLAHPEWESGGAGWSRPSPTMRCLHKCCSTAENPAAGNISARRLSGR